MDGPCAQAHIGAGHASMQGWCVCVCVCLCRALGQLTSTAAYVPPTRANAPPYCAIWLPVRTSAGHGLSRSTTSMSPQLEATAPSSAPASAEKAAHDTKQRRLARPAAWRPV